MSTPSQPQTPATAGRSLGEHRNKPVQRVTDQLETPSVDDRSYRVIKLHNKLEVLLVHDADTDKAGAAMDVHVGNFSDPPDLYGLAHLTEHLLFMGTEKYPEENAYSQYIDAHSGHYNAYTSTTHTNFYFEIAGKPVESPSSSGEEESPLYGALDRFAQFFIAPLFLSSTLDRELLAVDSENKKNLQNDSWRLHQLDKTLSNPKHPYCHFYTGSLETLKVLPEQRGVDIRQAFLKFYEDHYSANIMKLVILGREPLDTLEEWASDLFSDVKNKNLPPNRWGDEQPLGEKELLTQLFAKPVMEYRLLDLCFPFLDQEELFESQPGLYIGHLIGHEGPGSIMAYIKSKGWADGVGIGSYPICPGTPELFTCSVRLTEEGLKNYKEIVQIFFQYISLLHEIPPQEWIFEERKGMAEVDFKFKQKIPPGKFASQISAAMQKPLPREWLLSGTKRLRKFDPVAIKTALSCLRPDNFRMRIVSQDFPGDWDQTERWYGTEYKYEKIPAEFLAEIQQAASCTTQNRLPNLHLPHRNEFIPTKLEVEKRDVKNPAIAPKLIRSDELVHTWFKKDDTFWVPKANFVISLKNPLLSATAENSLKADLYAKIVQDALEEYAYNAQLAGLDWSIHTCEMGMTIFVYGYNDKLAVLLEKILVTMRDIYIKPDRFKIVKEGMERNMRSWGFRSPFDQVPEFVKWLNSEKYFINDERLPELERLTPEDIQLFYPQMLRQMHIEILVHGNMYKEDALRLTNLVENTLKPRPLLETQLSVRRCLIFPPGSNYLYRRMLKDPKNVNNCIEYSLYIGDRADRALNSRTLLLEQMAHEPAFNQLRTKDQLGYIIFSGIRVNETTIAYKIQLQSEKMPKHLEDRIDAFLDSFEKIMRDMSESDFEAQKRSAITKRLEKSKNLTQESNNIWDHIDSEYFDFELVYHDADHIQKLTKSDMIEFFMHYISPSSPARAKMAIHLIACGLPEPHAPEAMPIQIENGIASQATATDRVAPEPYVIENVREFRSRLAVTAGARPVKDLTEFEELDSKL